MASSLVLAMPPDVRVEWIAFTSHAFPAMAAGFRLRLFEVLAKAPASLSHLAEQLDVPAENLLAPDTVRRLCWDWELTGQGADSPAATAAAVEAFLRDCGARLWQRDLTVPVLTAALQVSPTDR